MKIEVGDTYREGDLVGEVTNVERFLDKDNDWHYSFVVYLPGHPDGEWMVQHAKEEDLQHESLS